MKHRLAIVPAILLAIACAASRLIADSALPQPNNVRLTNHLRVQNEEQCVINPVDTNIVLAAFLKRALGTVDKTAGDVATGRSELAGRSMGDRPGPTH